MSLRVTSKIKLVPHQMTKDKKNYIIEDLQSGDFYEMPEVCVAAIQELETGKSLEEVEFLLSERFPEEEVDLLSFATQLQELGLIEQIDGIAQGKEKPSLIERNQFAWISPKIGQFLFCKPLLVVYAALFLINITLMITQPNFFPHYKDWFLFDSMMLNCLLWLSVSIIIVLHHETGHILAVRASHLPARLGIGYRLFFVVFETEMTKVWGLPPRKRYVPYLAGLIFDNLLLSMALGLQFFYPSASPILLGIASVVVIDIFILMIYQCCFYMKTDLYYLFENLTGCYNVMENSKDWLKQRFSFFRKTELKETYFKGEEGVIRTYALIYMVGLLLSFTVLFIYAIPQMIHAFAISIPNLLLPRNHPYFWDALFFISQAIIMTSLLFFLWIRGFIQKRNQNNQQAL